MDDTMRAWRRRLAQTGGLVGALMLLMGTNDNNGCAPDPGGEDECTVAADCTGTPDANCVGSWDCKAGECVYACDPAPAGCYSNADCPGDLVCNASEICLSPPGCTAGQPCPDVCYGHCVEPDPEPMGCYSDGQCSEGQHCSTSDGDCQTPPGCSAGQACPAVCYGSCVPNEPEPQVCYGDQDCGAGTHCSVSDGVCNSPPGCDVPGMACPAVCTGECVPNGPEGCWSDADCGYGERCNTWDYCLSSCGGAEYEDADGKAMCDMACMGMCEPAEPQCQSNDDCKPGYICGCGGFPAMANGLVACIPQCIPDPNAACGENMECAPGLVCESGVCVEPQANCWSDADCGDGMQCNTWDYCGWPTDCAGGNCLIACMGVCEPKQGGDCTWDGECGAGQRCEVTCDEGMCDCDPAWGDCACPVSCTGTCVDDGPVHCSSDSDCAYNEYCGCAGGPWGGMPNGVMCFMQCMPKAYDCSTDADCGPGGTCAIEMCEGWGFAPDPACDPSDASCGEANKPAPPMEQCYGFCQAPAYNCDSHDDCASGQCDFVVCEAWAADPMPCSSNDPNDCFMPPPPEPYCLGYCSDPGPQQCGPNGECAEGYHCGCGNGPWMGADGGEASSGIACFPVCIKDDPTPVCNADFDCPAGTACVNGLCQVVGGGCQSDADCKDQDHCELGPCPLGPCTFDPATGQSWCPPCYGQCVPDEPQTDCSTDDECAAGEYCAIEYCWTACPSCVPGAVCPPCESQCFGTCEEQVWPQECSTDADCDSGESCACTPNPSCPTCSACFFQCVPSGPVDECDSDAECGPGQVCNEICAPCAPPQDGVFVDCPCWGTCEDKVEPVIPCSDDGSCPAGMMCDSCMQDPNCPMCDVCFAGCVAVEPPTSCQSDADCGNGYYCEQGPCPYFMPCSAEFGCPGCGGTCKEKEPVPTSCMVTGCSGQVCAAAPVFTTCEYKSYYACYQLASCAADAAGSCGWQGNAAFNACMAQFGRAGGGFFGATPR